MAARRREHKYRILLREPGNVIRAGRRSGGVTFE